MTTAKPRGVPLLESWLSGWRAYVLVCVVAGFAYFPSLRYDFVDLDDRLLIVNNREFLGDGANAVQAFRQNFFAVEGYEDRATYYRPLVILSYMFDMARGGVDPAAYHFTNWVLHIFCACLLFGLFDRIGRQGFAVFASLFFAVHPAFAQVVAWVPGRNDSLLACFVFTAFIALDRYGKTGTKLGLAVHGFAFAAALFTKEAAVVLVPLFFFFPWCFGRDWNLVSRAKLLGLAPIWGGSLAIWFLLRQSVVEGLPLGFMFESILANGSQLAVLFGKTLLPFDLSVYPLKEHASFLLAVGSIVVLVGFAVWGQLKRPRWMVFGAVWFLLFLAPTLVLNKPWDKAVFYEHRLYLPLVGVLILVGGTGVADRIGNSRLVLAGTAVVVAILTGLAWVHQGHFSSGASYWENAVRTAPSSAIAHMNLGRAYALKKDFEGAEKSFLRAAEIDPAQTGVHRNLGVLYYQEYKDLERAEGMFRKEYDLDPTDVRAARSLAGVLVEANKFEESAPYWRVVIEAEPDFFLGYECLAVAACLRRDLAEVRRWVGEVTSRGGTLREATRRKLAPCLGSGS